MQNAAAYLPPAKLGLCGHFSIVLDLRSGQDTRWHNGHLLGNLHLEALHIFVVLEIQHRKVCLDLLSALERLEACPLNHLGRLILVELSNPQLSGLVFKPSMLCTNYSNRPTRIMPPYLLHVSLAWDDAAYFNWEVHGLSISGLDANARQ